MKNLTEKPTLCVCTLNHTPQDPEELTSIEEDLDSLLANVEYIQSNIVELQNELIAVDDSKVNLHHISHICCF